MSQSIADLKKEIVEQQKEIEETQRMTIRDTDNHDISKCETSIDCGGIDEIRRAIRFSP